MSNLEDYPHVPLLFTSKVSYLKAWELFKSHMSSSPEDKDISPICCADKRDGMISLCESMKVDFSTVGSHGQDVLTSTLSLVNVVFESLLNVPDSIEKGFPDSMLPFDNKEMTPTLILTHKRPINSSDKAFFHRLDNLSFEEFVGVQFQVAVPYLEASSLEAHKQPTQPVKTPKQKQNCKPPT